MKLIQTEINDTKYMFESNIDDKKYDIIKYKPISNCKLNKA
jgi:hypothetical protein